MTALVYRMYDTEGALLYIGRTTDLARRLHMHFDAPLDKHASIPGATELRERFASLTAETFPTVPAARDAERAAITAEAPELNRHHNPRRWRWTGRAFEPSP